ncbi:MAG: GrpB family protein [Vagococcus sp.]
MSSYNDTHSQEEWDVLFQREKEQLVRELKANFLRMFQIGCSYSDVKKYPIMDILLIVRDLDSLHVEDMAQCGYTYFGETETSGRQFFRKKTGELVQYIHAFEEHNVEEIRRQLGFRDYLLTHPEERKKYCRLKEELEQTYSETTGPEVVDTHRLIQELEKKALVYLWHKVSD